MTETHTTDLVARLRAPTLIHNRGPDYEPLKIPPSQQELEIADTIERLTRERDEARSRFNDIDLCRMAQAPCNALLDAETRIAELTRERDEAREAALEEAAVAMDDWPCRAAAIRALKEPT
jgi:hypothetical protein